MTEPADQATQDAWRSLLFVHSQVVRRLEADLASYSDLPLTWLDIMNRLNEESDRRLRPHELADRSLFTRSGLTRLVDRIEEAGYVKRHHSTSDRRGVYVELTETGVETLEALWPDFSTSIQTHFGQHLTPVDVDAVTTAMSKILDSTR